MKTGCWLEGALIVEITEYAPYLLRRSALQHNNWTCFLELITASDVMPHLLVQRAGNMLPAVLAGRQTTDGFIAKGQSSWIFSMLLH